MKLLLILLSVMTITITTKNSASVSGDKPSDDTQVRYSNTYQKGDVLEHDIMALNVDGLYGITVEKIEAYVKSNKSSGAGVFTVRVNGGTTELASLSGTFKDWTGAWDNTEYHAITLVDEHVTNVHDIAIQLVGTANSLHVEKFDITWSSPAEEYDVKLMNGYKTITTLRGTEVVLPSLDDLADWEFVGWTDEAFANEWLVPGRLIPAGKYKPEEDETLWAVYRAIIPIDTYFIRDLVDGMYLYANAGGSTIKAMSGSAEDGYAGVGEIDFGDNTQRYDITFDAAGMATIKRAYADEYIGFEGTQLANVACLWNVYHEGDKTAFYTTIGEKTYMLLPGMYDDVSYEYRTKLVAVSNIADAPTVLVGDMDGDPLYTCYPEVKEGIEITNEGMNELMNERVLMHFGHYDLILINGKKELRRR